MAANTEAVTSWNDETWLYPLLAGSLSIPMVVALQYVDAGMYVIAPPFFAGLLVGIWSVEKPVSGVRVGLRAGLVSGLSLIYGAVRFLFSSQGWFEAQPIGMILLAIGAVSVVTGIYVLIFGAVGAAGGAVGKRRLQVR